jgi:hypothetical protein
MQPIIPDRGEVLSTTDKRLAVILLAFGAQFCQELPLGWHDIYQSKDAFIENLEDPSKGKPRRQISFNFEPTPFLKDLARAYQSKEPIAEMQRLLGKFDQARTLFAMEVFKEAIVAGEFLFEMIATMPDSAKWNVVWSEGEREMVKFGKNCSDELIAKQLSKV